MQTRLLRRAEVERLTALSRSSIYALMARGQFPRPVHVGERAARWIADEVEGFVAARIAARDRD